MIVTRRHGRALLHSSGGTTGRPKGVLRGRARLIQVLVEVDVAVGGDQHRQRLQPQLVAVRPDDALVLLRRLRAQRGALALPVTAQRHTCAHPDWDCRQADQSLLKLPSARDNLQPEMNMR